MKAKPTTITYEVASIIREHFKPGMQFNLETIFMLAPHLSDTDYRNRASAALSHLSKTGYIDHMGRSGAQVTYRLTRMKFSDITFHQSRELGYKRRPSKGHTRTPTPLYEPNFLFTLLPDPPAQLRERAEDHLQEAIRLENQASVREKNNNI